jgi:hypothetical protein
MSAKLGWTYSTYGDSDPVRNSKFDFLLGERKVGRPKRRWTEEMERELKEWVLRTVKDRYWKGINGRKL